MKNLLQILKTRYRIMFAAYFVLSASLPSIAQVLSINEVTTDVSIIKEKGTRRVGTGRYRVFKYLDKVGRVIKSDTYFKRTHFATEEFIYDQWNNIVLNTQTDWINPQKQANVCKYSYVYEGSRIILQTKTISDKDSSVMELVYNHGDTILNYLERSFIVQGSNEMRFTRETNYILKFQNGLLVSKEVKIKGSDTSELTKLEYDNNHMLNRRSIQRRINTRPMTYTGYPASDDEFYEYKLDTNGRIRKLYKIMNGRKYKIMTYKYKSK